MPDQPKTYIINLHDHDITIYSSDKKRVVCKYPPAGERIFIRRNWVIDHMVNGIPVYRQQLQIDNLPPERENVFYIVPLDVLQALKDRRSDLLVADTRNTDHAVREFFNGPVVGCTGFIVPDEAFVVEQRAPNGRKLEGAVVPPAPPKRDPIIDEWNKVEARSSRIIKLRDHPIQPDGSGNWMYVLGPRDSDVSLWVENVDNTQEYVLQVVEYETRPVVIGPNRTEAQRFPKDSPKMTRFSLTSPRALLDALEKIEDDFRKWRWMPE